VAVGLRSPPREGPGADRYFSARTSAASPGSWLPPSAGVPVLPGSDRLADAGTRCRRRLVHRARHGPGGKARPFALMANACWGTPAIRRQVGSSYSCLVDRQSERPVCMPRASGQGRVSVQTASCLHRNGPPPGYGIVLRVSQHHIPGPSKATGEAHRVGPERPLGGAPEVGPLAPKN